nr:PREDICTED: uncharacterized protein LOC105677225 [Linepithema humile]
MLKQFVERWFGVKNKYQAQQAKRKLSILYAFLGWNCFGIGFYYLLKDKIPENKSERREVYSKLTGTSQNVHVYQITGMTVKKEFDLVFDKMVQENKEAKEKEQTTVAT